MDLAKIILDSVSLTYEGFKIHGLTILKKIRHEALSEISMEVSEGETIAVMGDNGAGKSTLLKFLAGKIRPSSGRAHIRGRIIHLTGVNPGFDTSLSPRQNIQWLASIYGKEILTTNQYVEDFSDIGEAYDRPIKTLSAGMRGRVGFGFATSLDPDILLIDEVLGVGDPKFKAKAMVRLKEMISRSGIVVMSTHSVGLVKELASRCIILDEGKISHDGDVQVGIDIYTGNNK